MKLYATVTSERASKGQGGNEYLDIVIHAGSERRIISTIQVRKITGNVTIYTVYAGDEKIGELIDTKGEKQKGEHLCVIEGCELQREYAPGFCSFHYRLKK